MGSVRQQSDLLVAGIEIHQAVVVPQHAIALAREQHGDGDLGVDLCQPALQASDIGIAVLELSQAEETLVLGRGNDERGLAAFHLVTCGHEDGLASLVAHRQHLALGIHVDLHRGIFHLVVLHIEPVGQVAVRLLLSILYAHGILGHRGHRELSFAEWYCLGLQAHAAE